MRIHIVENPTITNAWTGVFPISSDETNKIYKLLMLSFLAVAINQFCKTLLSIFNKKKKKVLIMKPSQLNRRKSYQHIYRHRHHFTNLVNNPHNHHHFPCHQLAHVPNHHLTPPRPARYATRTTPSDGGSSVINATNGCSLSAKACR